ncbi:hypothetical protein Taro_044186 [Colocasia esculenta]|uniref:Uncharacterized protein n=1 Tax=Colocasia esculenta TaxID=4460 RepID=A0A843WTX0_COLES|nr:hypothetical protein [Colocasia esculenta]
MGGGADGQILGGSRVSGRWVRYRLFLCTCGLDIVDTAEGPTTRTKRDMEGEEEDASASCVEWKETMVPDSEAEEWVGEEWHGVEAMIRQGFAASWKSREESGRAPPGWRGIA